MSGKHFCLAGLVAAALGLGSAQGQGMTYVPAGPPPASETAPAPPPGPLTPSRWLLYERAPGCCGPTGEYGPIGYEIYLRSGIAFPVASKGLGDTLDNGWDIEIGARTLFFNPGADAAWTADVGIGNVYNRVGDRSHKFQLHNVGPNQLLVINGITIGNHDPIVTGSDLNRTFVNLAGGREWYLWGSAEQDGYANWRMGVDVGGRYGTEKLDLNETRHLTDTIGALFVAAHTDLEIPWGQVLLELGLRVEYGYTWTDILQRQNIADVQDLNLLFTAGMRF
jgi:hypothetical protein